MDRVTPIASLTCPMGKFTSKYNHKITSTYKNYGWSWTPNIIYYNRIFHRLLLPYSSFFFYFSLICFSSSSRQARILINKSIIYQNSMLTWADEWHILPNNSLRSLLWSSISGKSIFCGEISISAAERKV